MESEQVDSTFPRLHQSIASVLVNKSPLHGWWKAFGPPEEPTEAMDMGSLCHALLLGGNDIVPIEANDFRTNAAKALRDEVREAGKIPVLAHKLAGARILCGNVTRALAYRGIVLDGRSEMTVRWISLGGTLCEGRLDHYKQPGVIYDFKFARSANPEAIGRYMVDYGCDVQWAAYNQAIEFFYPSLAGRVNFLFVFIESEAPHDITIATPAGDMRALGQWKWDRACEIWRDCMAKYGTEKPWPGYTTEIVDVHPPAWALKEEIIKDLIVEGGNL